MISRNNRSRGSEHIFFSKNRVGRRRRQFGNGDPVMRVAKIDNARNARRLAGSTRNEHVVIIRVAVNHASAKAGELRRHVRFEQS